MTIEYSTSSADLSQWVLDTVLQALTDCNRAPISTAYVGAGLAAWDDCCGTLVVNPERIFLSQTFPTEFTDLVICDDGYIAVQFNVMLVRCAPTVDDRGRAPSAAAMNAAYSSLLEDAAVVHNALLLPLPDDEWMRTTPSRIFVGANGGCIAVESRFTLGIPQSQWLVCCSEPVPHLPGSAVCKQNASDIVFVPCEGLTATNVQDAICEAVPNTNNYTVAGGTLGTQPTFDGPPLFTAQYVRTGDLVHFEIQVDFDNITSFGTGQYYVTLPFPPARPVMFRDGCLHDDDTGREFHISGHAYANNVDLLLFTTDRQGNRVYDLPFEQGEPVTLTTADTFHIAGDYIAVPLP